MSGHRMMVGCVVLSTCMGSVAAETVIIDGTPGEESWVLIRAGGADGVPALDVGPTPDATLHGQPGLLDAAFGDPGASLISLGPAPRVGYDPGEAMPQAPIVPPALPALGGGADEVFSVAQGEGHQPGGGFFMAGGGDSWNIGVAPAGPVVSGDAYQAVAAVPLPAGAAMAGVGVLAVYLIRRRSA